MTDDFYRHLPRLETARLVIRPFTPADADDYFAFASDTEVTRYLRWGPHAIQEVTAEYLRYVLEAYARGEDSPWGIEVTDERKLIGTIHLMQLDRLHRKAQLGIVLARPYWRRGYAAEAMRKVIDYCLTVLELNRIEALCLAENAAAARMLERVGAKPDGVPPAEQGLRLEGGRAVYR